ncbi:MAG: tRNA (guanosine(37)-N1)-methyltransferase TrmD [Actinobacteria bacterium]|nr:tRNA (guanosine(37)-N1)-methyltransferase TrmD [Actinomycetota bacterium]
MRIDVLTLFPEYFSGLVQASLLGRAIDAGVLHVEIHGLRRWTTDRHRTADDMPYGGGAGMVLKPEPFFAAVDALYGAVDARPRTVVLTPRGHLLDQRRVRDLADSGHLLLLCGRYEGIDERVHDGLAHDEISIGDYVLAGGEVAAAVVIEAVTRLQPGVMGNVHSATDESHADGLLEYPQYTRPASFRDMAVPEILRSGDHARVAAWRAQQALERTRRVRPDLYARWERRGGRNPHEPRPPSDDDIDDARD